ncbi:hypothetical protein ACFIOY_26585 [Bradyrhizobium sp. TZ2]
MLNQLGAPGAQDIRVHIVQFDSTATSVGTYDIVSGGTLNAAALADAIADVNALNSGGSTNYEAGLQQALPFIQGVPSQTINVTSADSHDANSLGGSGNTDTAYIVGNGSTQIALVSGWTSPGTANSELRDVNNSTGDVSDGWGVQGGSSSEDVNTAEMLRFDFGSFNNFGVSNYSSGGFAGVNVQSATFTLDDNNDGGSTNFSYTIHFVGGATQAGSSNVNGNANITLTGTGGNAGSLIDYIEFTVTGGNSSGDIDLQSVVTAPVAPGTLPNADVNSLIFISDGEPNAANDSNGNPVGVNAQDAINQILGIDDSTNEVGQVEGNGGGLDQAFTIEAFHVGSPTTTLNVTSADSYDANSLGSDIAYIVGNGSTEIALVSGWTSPGTANSQLVDVNGNNDGIDDGWGVQGGSSDDNVNTTELLRFDFGSFNNFGVANYTSDGFAGIDVLSATFTLDDNSSGNTTSATPSTLSAVLHSSAQAASTAAPTSR